jgi:hypothetical protein
MNLFQPTNDSVKSKKVPTHCLKRMGKRNITPFASISDPSSNKKLSVIKIIPLMKQEQESKK